LCIAGNIENSKPAVESPAALNVQTAAEKVRYRNTAKIICSVSIPLPQDLKKRLDQYLDVEPKAPIIDVPQIKACTLCDMFDRRRLASCSVHCAQPVMPGLT
jgi:hypothetical protein